MRTTRWRRPGAYLRPSAVLAATTLLAFLGGCRFEVGEDENLEDSIEVMLRQTAAAWNAGDLEGVLRAYAEGASTSFMSADGPVYGRDALRARFAPAFEPGAERDSVRLERIEVRTLPPLAGIATGRYVLERDGEASDAGWFTLVVRRTSDGWRIVHDHSP